MPSDRRFRVVGTLPRVPDDRVARLEAIQARLEARRRDEAMEKIAQQAAARDERDERRAWAYVLGVVAFVALGVLAMLLLGDVSIDGF